MFKDKFNFNQRELNISIFRTKRVMILVKKFLENIGTIVWWKHPQFSILILSLCQIFLAFVDMNYILFYVLFGFITYSLMQHSRIGGPVIRFIDNHFRTPKNINRNYQEPLVQPRAMISLEKYLDESHMLKKLEDSRTRLKKLADLFSIYMDLPYKLHKYINIFIKLRNLFTWTDPIRTRCL